MMLYNAKPKLLQSKLLVPREKVSSPPLNPQEMFKSLSHSFRADPVNLMFTGIRGKGKTLSMSALAKYFREMESAPDQFKVWSNYPITFGEYHENLTLEICEYPEWLRNGIILVDEVATFMTALRAMSSQALEFSTFLQQVRKRRVSVWTATQFPWQVTSYTNTQINAFVAPTLYDWYEIPGGDPMADSVKLDFYDWFGYYGEPLNVRHAHWPPPKWEALSTIYLTGLIGSGAYESYNTEEIIEPSWQKRLPVKDVAMKVIAKAPEWTPLILVLDEFKACGIKSIPHLKVALEEIPGITMGVIPTQKGNARELAQWGNNNETE